MVKHWDGVDVPYQPKPILLAMGAFNNLIGDAKCTDKIIDDKKEVYSYIYDSLGGTEKVMALWNAQNKIKSISVDLGCEEAIMYDMYGNSQKIYAYNGKFNIDTSKEILYIKGDIKKYEVSDSEFVFTEALNDITEEETFEIGLNITDDNLSVRTESSCDITVQTVSNQKITATAKALKHKNQKIRIWVYDSEKPIYMHTVNVVYKTKFDTDNGNICFKPTGLNDTYDEQNSSLSLKPANESVAYKSLNESDIVLETIYSSKQRSEERIVNQELESFIPSSGNYYISFDICTDGTQDLVIAPLYKSANGSYNYIISMGVSSKNNAVFGEWHVGLNRDFATSPDDWLNVIFERVYGKLGGQKYFTANEWHNVKFLYDTAVRKVYTYIDDVFCNDKSYTDDINTLLIRNYTADTSGTVKYDNFQIGTYEELPAVDDCTIKDGIIRISFTKNVGDSLTENDKKVVITDQNDYAVDYIGQYNYNANIFEIKVLGYSKYNTYNITVQDYKTSDGTVGCKYGKNFKGEPIITEAKLAEVFDAQPEWITDYTNWGNKWLQKTYVEEYGRGSVLANNVQGGTAGANLYFGEMNRYLTDEKTYIKFDFKTLHNYNYTILPLLKNKDCLTGINLSTSVNGWIFSNKYNIVTVNGPNDSQDILDNSLISEVNLDDANNACIYPLKDGTWNTVMFVFDKADGKVQLYLNGIYQAENQVDKSCLEEIDGFAVYNHLSKEVEMTRDFFIDNLEIGRVKENEIKLVDSTGSVIDSFNDYTGLIYASAISKNTSESPQKRSVIIVGYNNENLPIDIKCAALTAQPNELGMLDKNANVWLSTDGIKTIKAFFWDNMSDITPLCEIVKAERK